MKKLIALMSCMVLCGAFVGASAADTKAEKKAAKQAEKGKTKKGTLYHVVSFKFKAGTTPEQIKEVEQAFAELKEKIPQIKQVQWGTNVSPEKHDKGFTHMWVLSFKTEKDRDDYLVHPDHKAFASKLGSVLDDVFVIDFWSEK